MANSPHFPGLDTITHQLRSSHKQTRRHPDDCNEDNELVQFDDPSEILNYHSISPNGGHRYDDM
jgi:hypothetical protein